MFKLTNNLVHNTLTWQKMFKFSSNPLQTQLRINSIRNAVRFENQNRTWTFQELEDHSNAFAYGLVEQQYNVGDKLLLWVEKANTSEVVAAQLGAAKAGVVLVPVIAENQQELEQQINDSNCKGLLFSPVSKLQNQDIKYHQIIENTVPETLKMSRGQELKSSRFPNLRYLVHTGFYSYPGTYKFRETLVYVSKNFNTLSLPQFNGSNQLFQARNKSLSLNDCVSQLESLRSQNNLNNTNCMVVCGDSKSQLAFTLGVLNTVLNGNMSVYTGNSPLENVTQVLEHLKNPYVLLDSDYSQQSQQLKNSASNLWVNNRTDDSLDNQ